VAGVEQWGGENEEREGSGHVFYRSVGAARQKLAICVIIWHFLYMTSMNLSLPEELKEYVESESAGGYSTPSEYVRELIREDRKRKAKERLDAMLLEGISSGSLVAMDATFWAELRQEALSKLAAKKTTRTGK
jgi:antitoxin ParD1/3/4